MSRMELKDFGRFLGSPCPLGSSSSSSSSQSPPSCFRGPPLCSSPQLFLLSSPASSSSCGDQTPDSPAGCSSSGSPAGGAVEFQSDCFSVKVDCQAPMGPMGPKRLCLVCGDFASGYHYGVASCEACKAFFKRTIQGNIEYSCPVTNECEITKRRRKACQACRFQKCLQAGMMREGVRLDRVRGGRQKYRRRVETGGKAPFSLALGSRNKLISHLLLTEPAPLAANQDDSTDDGSLRTLLTLCDLLNRELLVLIGWAKQIPGFSELSLVEQMSLLQSGWMEALLVGVAWRSQGRAGEELVFAGNLRLDEAQCRAAGLAGVYQEVRHLAARYRAMKMSPEEAVMLKAMALTNSDAELPDSPDSLQRLQDGLQEALQDYECSRGEPHRAGRLLMSLPLLRQSAARAAEAFRRLHRQHRVPIHKLLLEMLNAKS
ncbi:steroid hormone receptor ERR2 isoform X1 [Poecilia latipinna]|uniref:steroid hormone receptor ERR2 isoform X1 n=1 Tax=Poecilia latipinna TaxID=48699 RepID=UPI00072DFD04|nr:PREDICTED: steroid hormone receptor ERR2-like isoform X1 [Poecilia latipinna]